MGADLFSLTGKAALVTGASKGLGRAMALGLAKAGCDLALCARDAEGLRETRAAAAALGVRAETFAMDVLSRESVADAVEAVAGSFGRIDILVNN
ncbi:MAG TPA: SDR family NAD(P)-dependent oxidoreductase, partial [Deferrimonas sp.]